MSNARDNEDRTEKRQGEGPGGQRAVYLPAEEIGNMHYSTEHFSTALEYYEAAAQSPELGSEGKVRLLLRIIDCYRKKGENESADSYLAEIRSLNNLTELDIACIDSREGFMLLREGRYEESLKLGFKSYRKLRQTEAHSEVANTQVLIAHSYQCLGMLSEAEDFFSDALSTFRRADDRVGMAFVSNHIGILHKNACRWQLALGSLDRALEIARSQGMVQHQFIIQINLGVVYGKMRRFADAISSFEGAVNGAERFGDRMSLARALLMLGRTHATCRSFGRSEKAILRARAIAVEKGYKREMALADEYLGELMIARGNYSCALRNLNAGLDIAREHAPEGDVVAECLRRIADVHYHQREYLTALELIDEGMPIARSCGELFEVGFFLRTRALCLARLGRQSESIAALEDSVAAFAKYDNDYERGKSELLLGRLYKRHGVHEDLVKARHSFTRSIEEFTRLEESRELLEGYTLLVSVERRLGNIDEALLAIFEADRIAEEEQLPKFSNALRALRNKVENVMSTTTTHVLDQFSVLGEIQSGARSRELLVRGLNSTLSLLVDKLGAKSGFLAIPKVGGKALEVVCREGMSARDAKAIVSWCTAMVGGPNSGVRVITDMESAKEIEELRGKLRESSGSLVLQPLGFEGEELGVLCVRRAANEGPLSKDGLHFVAAYSSLISLSIYELIRSERRGQRRESRSQSKGFESIVTDNGDMIKLLNLSERVAHSDATVLLQGETGTGKGLISYAIHLLSERRSKKFIHVNCAALPEQLLESELFGHVRGSFTGAFNEKEGLLQQASGGTIFLDEIGKTSLAMQGKLLQFLDSSQVRKVGSNDLVHVDVRVICASKANLLEMCEEGRFLEDFFYRINDFPLTVPPLRDRKEDIPLLAHHYVGKICRDMGREVGEMSEAFMEKLVAYRWPGNVRELEKAIKRAVILTDDGEMLDTPHLAPEILRPSAPDTIDVQDELLTLRERIESLEQSAIAAALEISAGNKSKAAIQLGISYPNLLSKIKRYNIQ